MIRLILLLVLLLHFSFAIGCQCSKSIGATFLNQIKRFDLVALGTFHIDEQTSNLTLEVEKLYKGKADTKIIQLIPGGIDCNHSFFFKEGQKILVGLNKSPYTGQPQGFIAHGCITSILYVTDQHVRIGDKLQSLPAWKQRISLFSKTMKLASIERKIKRRS
jgi:hypothetical protein